MKFMLAWIVEGENDWANVRKAFTSEVPQNNYNYLSFDCYLFSLIYFLT